MASQFTVSSKLETMLGVLFQILLVCHLLVTIRALALDRYFPMAKHCGLKYDSVLKKSPWVCEESQYQQYPEPQINAFMKYDVISSYLGITKNCLRFHDSEYTGETLAYSYKSICAIKRKPINVIWAHVPGLKEIPLEFSHRQDGKLPVHVVRGQNLYDVECLHPTALEQDRKKADINNLRTLRGAERHLCYIGYGSNKNYVCQPTGFIQQDVLVYSPHANMMFLTRVTDIPTSCACTYCECATPFNPWGIKK